MSTSAFLYIRIVIFFNSSLRLRHGAAGGDAGVVGLNQAELGHRGRGEDVLQQRQAATLEVLGIGAIDILKSRQFSN